MTSVHFVPIDKEQPPLPVDYYEMDAVPFPGEDVVLGRDADAVEVQVIRRQFVPEAKAVRLFVRVLPPHGVLR